MIKLVFCLRRRDDVSEEEFHRYWLEEHGPLVRKHAEALGIRRYQQVHQVLPEFSRALGAGRGAPEAFDGVAEPWWDDADALAAPGQTEAGRAAGAALLEDEKRFIDHARSPIFLAEEHEIIPLRP